MAHVKGDRRLVGLLFLLTAALGLVGSREARGEHLQFQPLPPDITSGFILVEYDHTTGNFVASGYAATLDLDGVAPLDYNIYAPGSSTSPGSFNINLTLDQASGKPKEGTLTVGGVIKDTVPGLPGPADSGTLLTGDIHAFGFGGDGDEIFEIFEFVFDVTGGDLAPLYAPQQVGVILDVNGYAAGKEFTGSFDSDFNNDVYGLGIGIGVSDIHYTPEPSSLMALSFLGPFGILYGVCVWWRRRRQVA